MKGKIVYSVLVEKEIDIPDELIALKQKKWYDLTYEDDKRIEELSDSVWEKIPRCDRYGMYCGDSTIEAY